MAGNPNLIGGGRLTRAEVSGDKRRFEGQKLNFPVLLRRLWNYIGRNRYLLILALLLSSSSSIAFSLALPRVIRMDTVVRGIPRICAISAVENPS